MNQSPQPTRTGEQTVESAFGALAVLFGTLAVLSYPTIAAVVTVSLLSVVAAARIGVALERTDFNSSETTATSQFVTAD